MSVANTPKRKLHEDVSHESVSHETSKKRGFQLVNIDDGLNNVLDANGKRINPTDILYAKYGNKLKKIGTLADISKRTSMIGTTNIYFEDEELAGTFSELKGKIVSVSVRKKGTSVKRSKGGQKRKSKKLRKYIHHTH
jgi:hypothetical protein